LARAAEVALAEIGDLSREPREAIIACYAAMERELSHVPDAVPQDFDTPTEVLARAVEHHALQADNASQLVKLFAEARFSPHVMNEGHRESALRALEFVLAELRSMV
jgi:2-hydroxychromene-2-carboxylate isomerase